MCADEARAHAPQTAALGSQGKCRIVVCEREIMSAPAPGPAVFLGVAMVCFGAFNAYIGYSMWGDRGKANRSRLGEIINGPSLIGGGSSSSSSSASAQGEQGK